MKRVVLQRPRINQGRNCVLDILVEIRSTESVFNTDLCIVGFVVVLLFGTQCNLVVRVIHGRVGLRVAILPIRVILVFLNRFHGIERVVKFVLRIASYERQVRPYA